MVIGNTSIPGYLRYPGYNMKSWLHQYNGEVKISSRDNSIIWNIPLHAAAFIKMGKSHGEAN
jgi:hypothetical protein